MKHLHRPLVNASIRYPRTAMILTILVVIALGALMPRLTVDTDPENMLPADQSARVFHNATKKDFNLYDMIVVGVVNESDPNGVFNPTSLGHLYELTRHIENIEGVVRRDIMSLASVDNISQGGPGVVRFEWMMDHPPKNQDEANRIRESAMRLPTIFGTLVSEDGRAAGIYVPIVEKSESHRIATEIEAIVDGFKEGNEEFFITGLPVAEDTFGVEMFKQMGIAAPLAGLIIFIMMLIFFRSIALITAPMIVAIATVTATMGLLIGLGFTVHIMSSMIPIFLMPIAVVNSVHILSRFVDFYPRVGDRAKTIQMVMDDLFQPMLYTSLTSAAGFISLAFAPIPPVRVFGIFVSIGIMISFFMTVIFLSAYVVRLSEKRIHKLCNRDPHDSDTTFLARLLSSMGPATTRFAKPIVVGTMLIIAISAYGISKIQINDNPVRWFRSDHRIRVADRVLNHHFGGTYNAFIVLSKESSDDDRRAVLASVDEAIARGKDDYGIDVSAQWKSDISGIEAKSQAEYVDRLIDVAYDNADASEGDAAYIWEDVVAAIEDAQSKAKYFQSPEGLAYVERLQDALLASGMVGKSNSIVEIVKTVHRELREGDDTHYTVPNTSGGVAQSLLSYQSSHRPHDLWHFVTPDYRATNLWLQLKSGDNQDMVAVTDYVDDFIAKNPLPAGVTLDWAGLTYLNVVWQSDMVGGTTNALMGSFVIVFIMMLILFRSVWFGLLAMLPLSVTIALVYGLMGLVGKDYDMPVAVLSSLTLGLSVDFAIHFLQRIRRVYHGKKDWNETIAVMFGGPARAIFRNAVVISIGFLPLLASPLVPYNTVGFFLAAIMAISAAVTLILLPAVMHLMRRRLFSSEEPVNAESTPITNTGGTVMKSVAPVVLALTLAFTAMPAGAQDLTDVNEIITKANNAGYYAGDDGRAQVRMTITDEQGRTRRRQFTILRKDRADGGDQDYAVLFSRPADVRGTVFLVKKHVDSDDDRWLYLPDLDLVKRIAAGDKRTSFVGSHFFYEDVSGRRIAEDTHELIETTPDYYVVKNVPKDEGAAEFASWTAWIDKTNFIPMKMEYVDDAGEVYRRIEALEVQDISGYPTTTKMKVTDLRSGGYTVSEFRGIEYDLGIPDDVFTERTLRSPSRQWFGGK